MSKMTDELFGAEDALAEFVELRGKEKIKRFSDVQVADHK